jgi:hypothetical protein
MLAAIRSRYIAEEDAIEALGSDAALRSSGSYQLYTPSSSIPHCLR